jgi:hypothetical protein
LDYHPLGMQAEHRSWSSGDGYRFGFYDMVIGFNHPGSWDVLKSVNPNWTQFHLHFEIWSSISPIRRINPYTVFPELALLPFDTHRGR